jgi:hypothetical protein
MTISALTPKQIEVQQYAEWTPAKYTVFSSVPINKMIPPELIARCINFSGEPSSTTYLVCSKDWEEPNKASNIEIFESYKKSHNFNELITKILKKEGKEVSSFYEMTDKEQAKILKCLRQNVVNRALSLDIPIENQETVPLKSLMNEVISREAILENKSLITIFNHLRQLNIITVEDEIFEGDLESQNAERIREWMNANQELLSTINELDLSDLTLKILPKEIALFSNLQTLDLSRTNLIRLSDSFGNLKALETLYLGSNKLTELPDSFDNLNALQSLYLENNKLTRLPDNFCNLNALDLDLSYNKLTVLPDYIFHKAFKSFKFSDNPCSIEPDDSIKSFSTLQQKPRGFACHIL